MQFRQTDLPGVVHIVPEPHGDARGALARLYCPEEFAEAGLGAFTPLQVNLSRNAARHTLRGLHWQDPPEEEAKLVHVVRGAIWDVAVDLRPDSATYRRWVARRLDAAGMEALFIPEGCAHGFLTLEPETDVLYHMGRLYAPGHGRGARWNDPAFAIDWPAPPQVIDPRDANYPDFPG
ncbi:MAG: dTDP-4-dehydrorhamnose 3,5-epimerase family protein [Pseudomonadota bacterium]